MKRNYRYKRKKHPIHKGDWKVFLKMCRLWVRLIEKDRINGVVFDTINDMIAEESNPDNSNRSA